MFTHCLFEPFQFLLHTMEKCWNFLSCIIIIALLCTFNQTFQISISKKKNSIFGEFLKSIFMVLHEVLLQTIGDELF